MCAGATSMPAVSVGRITSPSDDRPSARTSAIDRSTVLRLMPRPAVKFACGSMSTQRTRYPSSARAPARLIAVVVLPTPPFLVSDRDHVRHRGITSESVRRGTRPSGEGSGVRPSYLRGPSFGHPVIHTLCELFTESVDIRVRLSTGRAVTMMALSLRKDRPNGVSQRCRPTRSDSIDLSRCARCRARVAARPVSQNSTRPES